jgi:hypothetical protein
MWGGAGAREGEREREGESESVREGGRERGRERWAWFHPSRLFVLRRVLFFLWVPVSPRTRALEVAFPPREGGGGGGVWS